MAPRLASPATLAGVCGVLVVWMGVTLWSVSSRVDRISTNVVALAAAVDAGLTQLEGKVDLLTGQLRHAQPGGFHDKSPQPAAVGDAVLHATKTLEEQLQRLTQGVAHVDRLKQRLETAIQLAETAFAAGGGGPGAMMGKDGDNNAGVVKDAAVGRVRRGGERGLKSEFDFGKPANQVGSPPDNADEALWQQTIKMNPGDPIPLVGRAFHPWYSNADHSRKTTYVHLLKDKYGAKRNCKYVDVFFWQKASDRCALIVPDREIKTRTVEAELDMETGVAKPLSELRRDHNPLDIKPRDARYWAFAEAKDEMVDYLWRLVGTHERKTRMALQDHPEPIVVMCANDGHLGLLLNWACSLRAANLEMPKHVIFVTSASTRDFLKSLGFTAYYHSKIGTYPSHASKKYSDFDFGMMMILKQVAVALSLETGYDVLFQDVDITWIKDPRQELLEQAKYYEVQFQDDGARNQIYQPWYANTGFAYLRSTYVVRDFWDTVTRTMPSYPQSNQLMVNWVLEGYVRRGHPNNHAPLTIRVLPQDEYPAGNSVDLPGARNFGQSTEHTDVRPLSPTAKIAHFCWTHNITYKIQKLKGYRSLYVTEECLFDWKKCVPGEPDTKWADAVCKHRDLPPLADSYETWVKNH